MKGDVTLCAFKSDEGGSPYGGMVIEPSSNEVRVFLSSTFTDLKELRQAVSRRLTVVLGAQLIVMESFGSDDAPPDIASVRRVRECDVFVGIYARRYGSVDPGTGMSITALELDEAERAASAGNILAILLYLLNDGAPWPASRCDTDTTALQKLHALKERARRHTITKFWKAQDLPYLVIKDVLSKIKGRLGAVSAKPRQIRLPEPRKLLRPTGMEFLTSADRHHFYGRGEKIQELMDTVESNQISLLLGNSGSGKTSLVHAGFFPKVFEREWLPIYARPLGLPQTDVTSAVCASAFEGTSSYRGSLVPLLEQVLATLNPACLVLVIDQFEDVLVAREQAQVDSLVADLRTLRYVDSPQIRVVLAYRADLEARLGLLWQSISGSPQGLPRVYVGGISPGEAWKSVQDASGELRVILELTDEERHTIEDDLFAASSGHGEDGVYPPYIQMLIDHIWRMCAPTSTPYRFRDYYLAGGIEGITGGFLTRQLSYAQDSKGHVRAVLASLVRSYGVKAQKTLCEISSDVGIDEVRCETVLERLIDLRLVRHVGDNYEVAHDFLAREIAEKLVDSEEREFKRFRELLTTKAAAFATTRALLSTEELLILFSHKERVVPSDYELGLILASWTVGHGPGLYWLLRAFPSKVLDLIRAEETRDELEEPDRAFLALLRKKIGGTHLTARDWNSFRRYQLAIEMAGLLAENANECPDKVLSLVLRSKPAIAREAAIEAVAKKIASGQRKWISELSRSNSPSKRTAYELLALREDLTVSAKNIPRNARRSIEEFLLLQRIARSRDDSEIRRLFKTLRRHRPKARTLLFAKGIVFQRTQGLQPILGDLSRLGASRIGILLSCAWSELSVVDFQALVEAYLHWNDLEAQHMNEDSYYRRALYEDKARILAQAIRRVATPRDLKTLRDSFGSITLTPSSQYYAQALLRVGTVQDVVRIIKKLGDCRNEVRYWIRIEMARAIENRMAELQAGIPPALRRIASKKMFWKDPRREGARFSHRDQLPLKQQGNRGLYLTLVAHALIGATKTEDSDVLRNLARHDFRLVARAAAVRLSRLAGDAGIKMLQTDVKQVIEGGNPETFALALRAAEIQNSNVAILW